MMGKTCYFSVKYVSFTLICHALSLPCSFKFDFILGGHAGQASHWRINVRYQSGATFFCVSCGLEAVKIVMIIDHLYLTEQLIRHL